MRLVFTTPFSSPSTPAHFHPPPPPGNTKFLNFLSESLSYRVFRVGYFLQYPSSLPVLSSAFCQLTASSDSFQDRDKNIIPEIQRRLAALCSGSFLTLVRRWCIRCVQTEPMKWNVIEWIAAGVLALLRCIPAPSFFVNYLFRCWSY